MASGSGDSPLSALECGVRSFYETHVPDGARVCVALSGGLDSTVLLHLTCRAAGGGTGIEVGVLHIDHGLSPNSGEWADFCSEQCRRLGVPLEVVRTKLAPEVAGMEVRARAARRAAYARCGAEYVALAHHLDDQAETFLFRALRGSGAGALGCMAAVSPLSQDSPVTLLRPLLDCGRRSLHVYAAAHGLDWREDESNRDERITRNFVRNRALPFLEERFPHYRAGLRIATDGLRDCRSLLAQLAQLDQAAAVAGEGWAREHFRRAGLLRTGNWIHHLSAGVGREACSWRHARETARQIRLPAGHARRLRLDLGEQRLAVHGDSLFLVRSAAEAGDCASVRLRFDDGVRYRDSRGELTFDRDDRQGIGAGILRTQGIELRRRTGGERLDDGPGRPRRRIKELLRAAGVPSWEREAVPLVFVGGALAAVPNIAVGVRHAANGEKGYFPRWRSHLTVPSGSVSLSPF